MIALFSFIVVAWLLMLFCKVAYYCYLWQVKEYRVRRLWASMQEPDGLSAVFTKSFYGSLVLGIVILLLFPDPIVMYVAGILYGIGFLFSCERLIRGKQAFPKLTLKAVFLFVISFGLPLVGFLLLPLPSVYDALIYLVITDVLVLFIVSLLVVLLKPVSFLLKQRIVVKAKAKRRQYKNLIAIGISGNVGKTSTKEFLAHILSEKFSVAKTKEHQNTEVGAARAILGMKKNTQVLVAEMGAYHQGDVKEISSLVKPTIGIITSVGEEHLSLFGDLETAIETEFELASMLPDDGSLVVNWDNEYIKSKFQSAAAENSKFQLLRYSNKDKKTDVYATDITQKLESIAFTVHDKKRKVKKRFQADLIGVSNVSNILAATAVALHLGMKLGAIAKAVAQLSPPAHTMKFYHGIGNLIIIDDSYNASPQAVQAAFAHVKHYAKKKKILVMPSLIELGDSATTLHEQLAKDAAARFDAAIITDRKYEDAIRRGWQAGKGKEESLFFAGDTTSVARLLEQLIDDKTLLLLEGRSPKDISSALLHHFYAQT